MEATDRQIPLARQEITEGDIEAVVSALRSDRLALGPWAEQLERELASFVGVSHAVVTNSGTSALHLIVRALGIGEGDEVVTTPFSFIASTNCILFERATPVFVDIDSATYCIDTEQIEAAITPQTRAILAVDVFGHPADWAALEAIADEHGLHLIDDSAEALGSDLGGRRCGGFGTAGIFGFYPNKQITTGEGGAVVTDDDGLAEACRSMANQGRSAENQWLQHVRLGFNYRMDELSAALGCSQLERIERTVAERARAGALYDQALGDIPGTTLPPTAFAGTLSRFVYVVRLDESFDREDRDAILRGLQQHGIGCGDYFQPIHLQPFIRELLGTKPGDLPIAESVGDRTIALPFFVGLGEEDVTYVADALQELIDERRRR